MLLAGFHVLFAFSFVSGFAPHHRHSFSLICSVLSIQSLLVLSFNGIAVGSREYISKMCLMLHLNPTESHPRVEQDLAAFPLVKEPVVLGSIVQAYDAVNETRILSNTAKYVLPFEQDIEGDRERRAYWTAPEVERYVLVVDLATAERYWGLLVHTDGADGAERADNVICERERAVVPDDLRACWRDALIRRDKA